MDGRWLRRVVVAASTAGVLFLAGATLALAHDTPTAPYDAVLQDSHHGKVATFFTNGCADVDQAGIAHGPTEDVWVFNTPADEFDPAIGVSAQFRRLDLTVVTELIPGSSFANGFGNSPDHTHLAWIVLPAGWTLLDAEGKSKGDQTRFVVTHTCPGTPGPGPSPSPSSPVSGSSGPSDGPSEPGDSESPSDPGSSSDGDGGTGGGLPVTGTAVTTIALVGVAMVVAGVALLVVRRRRDISDLLDG